MNSEKEPGSPMGSDESKSNCPLEIQQSRNPQTVYSCTDVHTLHMQNTQAQGNRRDVIHWLYICTRRNRKSPSGQFYLTWREAWLEGRVSHHWDEQFLLYPLRTTCCWMSLCPRALQPDWDTSLETFPHPEPCPRQRHCFTPTPKTRQALSWK